MMTLPTEAGARQPDAATAPSAPAGLTPRRVAAYIPDLFFSVRVTDAIQALGGVPDLVESADELWEAIGRWPALVLIDMTAPGDWLAVVRRARNLPHTRLIPIVAFGSHLESGALTAARQAGCDHAWARSRFVQDLPALLRQHLQKIPEEIEGWDDAPAALAVAGFEAFNAGHYWEQHELLEAAWREEARPVRALYQGILQVGVALHQIEQGKWAGAIKLLRRGLNRLDRLPPLCMGVDLDAFRRQAYALHQHLMELGTEQPAATEPNLTSLVDRSVFPHIITRNGPV